MNAGESTIEWLYKNSLQVDAQWSIRTERGFTWWPHQHAQTVEITGEAKGPAGAMGSCISVLTEVLREFELTDRTAITINEFAKLENNSMSGLVYDAQTRRLNLCSLVLVHDDMSEWMQPLIGMAAALQGFEAEGVALTLVRHIGAIEALSGHPTNGMRNSPDEMANIAKSLIAPIGETSCAWTGEEFKDAVDQYMQQPPALLAHADRTGFTVEFPYGDVSSLCEATSNHPHRIFGNGLHVIQSFPTPRLGDVDGAKAALLMNTAELTVKPMGYGFGSYFYRDGLICFSTFFPNYIHKPGLLPNLYFASAQRARAMSVQLTGKDWMADSFDFRRSAIGGAFFGPPSADPDGDARS